MTFEGRFSEGLSLVDAVMPDVVVAKQRQLREKIAAEKLKAEQDSQAIKTEKEDEEMTSNGAEQTSTASASDSSATTMTTTVVTAATSTTTNKQENQANGEVLHGRLKF